MTRPRRDASLALLCMVALTASACQQGLGGTTQAPIERIEVADFTIEGVEVIDESELQSVLATEERSWLPFSESKYFDRMAFEADVQRIEAFYADRGYPDARVVDTDVDLLEGGDGVALRVVVEEGEPVRVANVTYTGFDVLGPGAVDGIRQAAPVQIGEALARPDVLQTTQIALAALHDAGYAYAQVNVEDTRVAPDRVHLTIRARPGLQAFFGGIEVAGNTSVDDQVIRHQLTYRPGELFRASALRESQRRLYALGLFQFANIEVVEPEADAGGVRTRVTVTERNHRQLEFSLGYGTEERLTGEAELRHVNFFGGARTATLHGKWSWLESGVEGTFVQPYLFRSGLSLEVAANTWYADERAYRVFSRGGRAGVSYVLGPHGAASASYQHTFQSSRISAEALADFELRDELIALGLNPTTGEQDGLLSALQLDVGRDTTENLLDPTRGYRTSIRLEQAGGWLPGSFNYYNVLGDARHYHSVGGVTLAQRVRYGSIDPMSRPSDVPFFKRYFLGGADSLRGWGRFEVSPLSGFGLPIGGHSLFVASSEARFPVAGSLGAVVFADAGNVWQQAWNFYPDDLVFDAGVGVRYHSPVGPLRLDAAYQLTPIEGLRVDGELQERRWRIHFSIGQAF